MARWGRVIRHRRRGAAVVDASAPPSSPLFRPCVGWRSLAMFEAGQLSVASLVVGCQLTKVEVFSAHGVIWM